MVDPYGARRTFMDGKDRTGYIGKERDAESELADHGVRKYDAELGRFLLPDPL
ncbi:MAG: RHS repeat-associated core domain-containing protein, partial [Candidatus Kapaibacterium sp.]